MIEPSAPDVITARARRRHSIFLAITAAIAVGVILLAHSVMRPFVLAFVIAYVLTPAVAWVERKRVPRASLLAGGCGLALSLGLIVAERGRISAPLSAPHGRPARATAFVLEHDIAERPFHTIAFGSYFMWDAYGRRKTFIDGRNVSAEVYRDFLFAQASDDGWRAAIRKYRIDSFILPPLAVSDDGIRG